MKVTLGHSYANEYSAGGNDALIDGMQGTEDFRSGAWQGTQNEDLEALVDLGSSKKVSSVEVNFLKDQRSWIFWPKKVTFEYLDENKKVIDVFVENIPETGKEETSMIHRVKSIPKNNHMSYIRMKATTYGKLPEWHLGHPFDGTSWIFIDEINVN